MGLQECQESFTSTEFLEAMELMSMEWEEHDKIDYYLAQIALKLCQAFGDESFKDKTPSDFLLKFVSQRSVESVSDSMTPEQIEDKKRTASATSKAVWLAVTGLKKDGTPLLRGRRKLPRIPSQKVK